jgi:cysteine-rich repeat protein
MTRLPVCGDAIKEDTEACDDGNLSANDGCNELCQIEYPRCI